MIAVEWRGFFQQQDIFMKPYVLAISIMLFQFTGFAYAGILVNGSWTPRSCGIKPPPPAIDDSTVDAFNKSVAAINLSLIHI